MTADAELNFVPKCDAGEIRSVRVMTVLTLPLLCQRMNMVCFVILFFLFMAGITELTVRSYNTKWFRIICRFVAGTALSGFKRLVDRFS